MISIKFTSLVESSSIRSWCNASSVLGMRIQSVFNEGYHVNVTLSMNIIRSSTVGVFKTSWSRSIICVYLTK